MKKKQHIFILLLLLILPEQLFPQQKFWVFFTDKYNTYFDPFGYFHHNAIERRIKQGIPLSDSTDFPVNNFYIDSISRMVDNVRVKSRWFNCVSVTATARQIKLLNSISFVKKTEPLRIYAYEAGSMFNTELTKQEEKLLENQLKSLQGDLFIEKGINGSGISIAIFDTGFPTVNKSPVFDSINEKQNIVETYDFSKKREFVYGYTAHGTAVLSCISGHIKKKHLGLATGAKLLLARTELRQEKYAEEEYWLEAAEWADKNGAHIINSSLGYTYKRYFTDDMDGKTSLVAKAANMAARKGILVINAMGNDGQKDWKILGTPADADSVLSIGAIGPDIRYHSVFSSFGPTADKRLKPNLSAFGTVIAAGEFGLHEFSGTSFSCGLITGFAACAWQLNPSCTNMQLFEYLQKSGSLYPYCDYAHGYGVPQASFFLNDTLYNINTRATFTFIPVEDSLTVFVFDEFINLSDKNEVTYLYYHIENPKGTIDKYAVIEVYQQEALRIALNEYTEGELLRVCYKNYVATYILSN